MRSLRRDLEAARVRTLHPMREEPNPLTQEVQLEVGLEL